jgi:phosphoglycolate phosphatase-like HAD superfamily hydrolase
VRLSLVTGNLETVARLKLDRAGLGPYFPPARAASAPTPRIAPELPAIARRRAGDGEHAYPKARTVVVGDTPNDIACARADGVRCVAVTTGPYAADELHRADAVIAGLDELAPMIVTRPSASRSA